MRSELHEAALTELLDLPGGAVDEDNERRAYLVENRAKLLLSQPGTGRTYTTRFYRDHEGRLRRGTPRVPHTASAPGQPPAVDTGLLRASVEHHRGEDAEGFFRDIGSPLDVGTWTELGTRYMAARPWIRPALDAATEE